MKNKGNYYIMTKSGQKRFKHWLIEQEISQVEFAKRCGISKQYLYGIVTGKSHITQKVREQFKKGGYDLV